MTNLVQIDSHQTSTHEDERPPNDLDSPRLRLRPLVQEDSEQIFAIRSLKDVYQWSSLERWTALCHAEEWIRNHVARPDTLLYSIQLKLEDTKPLEGKFLSGHSDSHSGDTITIGLIGVTRTNHLTYLLDPTHWGHGFMTEALLAFIPIWKTCYPTVNFLEAFVAADNVRSRRVLEKCGFYEDSRHGERRNLSELDEAALKFAVQGLGLIGRREDAETPEEEPKRNKFVMYYLFHEGALQPARR